MTGDPGITLGIEEEFFLVDRDTFDLVADPDPGLLAAFAGFPDTCRVVPELLRSQVELNSPVCRSVAEARAALVAVRRALLGHTDRYGVGLMGASTHPFAAWETQAVTPRERYREFAVLYQTVIRQLVASGMHVHAGFGTPDERVQVLTAMRRYLPLFLTLSGSSPFSGGHVTGFKSARMNLMAALPRSGLPPALSSWADYEQIVENYRGLGFVQDGSEIWWDLRPSVRFPTLELRIADICPDVDDAMALVALYACLVRHLLHAVRAGRVPAEPPTEIIQQNRWLAQRYGVVAFLADFESGTRVDLMDYVEELLGVLAADAAALACEREVAHVRTIVREGSSADRQLDHFRLCRLDGAGVEEALRSVARLIVDETRRGVREDAGT